ncbi:MAG: tRNA (adenosine(37)-N6)-threonylcarbamoyltransferase complex dimerization subunit type 1 TsaB [Desulfuromonas sp.]|nr:tRNA (adenosine(37)-N6)-threonylcarbamoyltransferase complex dimerization subunit type 1 TsaB [Desulfuromonas sp.]
MKLLTIQTATPAGSVALSDGNRLLGELFLDVRRPHGEWLLGAVDRLLGAAGMTVNDLDGFGVTIGPGSFTGLRVGLATIKGLALATGKPVAGVSTLQTLAMQAPHAALPVCALLDARKKEVYAGIYHSAGGRLHPLTAERVLPPEQLLAECVEETLFVGDGATVYRTLIARQLGTKAHFLPAVYDPPRAAHAALLAAEIFAAGEARSAAEVNPVYIRPSEAELNKC